MNISKSSNKAKEQEEEKKKKAFDTCESKSQSYLKESTRSSISCTICKIFHAPWTRRNG